MAGIKETISPFAQMLQKDPGKAVATRYTDGVYGLRKKGEQVVPRNTSDSPDASRVLLARSAAAIVRDFTTSDYILDLGSGPDALMRDYLAEYAVPACNVVSLDFAHLQPAHLLHLPQFSHVRADGTQLPFKDGIFQLVVSNMAYDYIRIFGKDRAGALSDLYRVMSTGAYGLMHLHHPSLIPPNLDMRMKYPGHFPDNPDTVHFMNYLQEHNFLYTSLDEIQTEFSQSGFRVQDVAVLTHRNDTWWKVGFRK